MNTKSKQRKKKKDLKIKQKIYKNLLYNYNKIKN